MGMLKERVCYPFHNVLIDCWNFKTLWSGFKKTSRMEVTVLIWGCRTLTPKFI